MSDTDEPDEDPDDATEAPEGPTREQLKRAMKAFRKRMKLMRLDDESRVGGGPMSGGRSSGIAAITPPNQYPTEVWEELARQGRLKYSGNGMYEIGSG
jgi:hypothetical protein